MTDDSHRHALEWIARESGLDGALLAQPAVRQGMQRRCGQLGLPNINAYHRRLQTDAEEFERLINDVAVSETWFFRYPQSFELLQDELLKVSRRPGEPSIRMFSAACATGEEPYSMAIAAISAGLRPGQFHILAVDRHEPSLSRARRGVYRELSRVHPIPPHAERFFCRERATLSIRSEVAATIEFRCEDVRNMSEPPQTYDVIFCRNLLIYLDEAAKHELVARLVRWLRPGGLLFVGHAELSPELHEFLDLEPRPRAFAWRKRMTSIPDSNPKPLESLPAPLVSGPGRPPAALAQVADVSKAAVADKKPGVVTGGPLPSEAMAAAKLLADGGQLAEAARILTDLLATSQPTAKALYLLGTVQLALQDEVAAADALQRAVYLDPGHDDALWQLAVLSQRRGNQRQADRYWRRAATARQRRNAAGRELTDE